MKTLTKVVLLTFSLYTVQLFTYPCKAGMPQSRKEARAQYVTPDNLPDMREFQKKWYFGAQGGISYRVGANPEGLSAVAEDYLDKLRLGLQIGAEAAYFPKARMFGYGIKYSYFRSSNSGEFYITDDQGNSRLANISDQIEMHFGGPAFFVRFTSKKNLNAIILSGSLGVMTYKQKSHYFEDFTLSGVTAGICVTGGYDIATSDQSAISIQLAILSGFLDEIKEKRGSQTRTITLAEDEYESLARIELSVGFRFMK
ncbi:MAG: hypothetical protein ABJF04_06560 [Reichenbachiella sp.]|uniref:hypothetical protein n=3 Tax=Reichenbachiella sp. TaxID=2184521 RepID=UPI003263A3BC